MNHSAWMQRALTLARKAEGLTRPNPPVGAVVVSPDGELVGEGYHAKAGGPHAEVVALDAAGSAAQSATLYVTLEPCSTQGRTPACTDRVLASGVSTVVVGCEDPNPVHAGRGLSLLREAGITVVSGCEEPEARALIAPFVSRLLRGRPFVTLKLGMSLDGRIADASGTSQWITGSASRDRVQALRRRVDAILVGSGTVLRDDPSLTPRPDDGRAPFRVFIDRRGQVSGQVRLLSDELASRTLRYDRPVSEVLESLASEHDVMHVLCEGGSDLAGALMAAGLVDELWLFQAGMILGGAGLPAIGGNWALKDAPRLNICHVERVGDDVLTISRPK